MALIMNYLIFSSQNVPRIFFRFLTSYPRFLTFQEKKSARWVKEIFGDETGEILLSFSMMRWAYQTPIKRSGYYHCHDFVSEELHNKALDDKKISNALKIIGENREKVVTWMQGLLKTLPNEGKNFVMMDSTHNQTLSEKININAVGYNPDFDYDKQVRLMYLFSSQMKQPVYYRMINGNIPDVKSISLCIKEFGTKDIIYIADKGFYSKDNLEMLDNENLQYIIPLRRNNSLINFSVLQ